MNTTPLIETLKAEVVDFDSFFAGLSMADERNAAQLYANYVIDFTAQRVLEAVREGVPRVRHITSEIHTADIRILSSTGIELEQNKGFNQAREDILAHIDTLLATKTE